MTTPAEKFVADLYASHHINPIDDNEFIMTFDAEGKTLAFFHVYPSFDEKTIHISFMRTYPQKKGIGTQALKRLQDLATKDGISIDLEPWENSPVPKAALRKFYAKAGFKGRDTMTWHPNVQQASNRELGQYVRHGDNAAKVERSRRITMGTLKEEAMMGGAPTNSAGAGAIAGIGIGPQGEPGRKNVMTTMRRKANIINRIKKEAVAKA